MSKTRETRESADILRTFWEALRAWLTVGQQLMESVVVSRGTPSLRDAVGAIHFPFLVASIAVS